MLGRAPKQLTAALLLLLLAFAGSYGQTDEAATASPTTAIKTSATSSTTAASTTPASTTTPPTTTTSTTTPPTTTDSCGTDPIPAPEITNCATDPADGQTISVTWTKPDTGCDVTSYNVDWTGYILWSGEDDDGTDNSTVESYTLKETTPYTSYSVCVLGLVEGLEGDETSCDAQTAEAPPSAPQDVSAVASDSRSLSVSWRPPDQLNGVIESYTVTVGGITPVTVPNDTFSSDVTGLEPCETYDVTVVATNGGSKGDVSEGAEGTTDEEAPPAPGNTECLLKPDGQTISVTWAEPATACDVTSYNVGWTGDILWSDEDDNNSSSTADLSYTLQQTTPYTGYSVCVLGLVEGLQGNETCCEEQTEEAPPSAPQDVSAEASGSRSLSVSWGPPAQLNGVIESYTVTVGGITPVTVPGDTFSTNMTDLDPCETYHVTLVANNGGGEGKTSVAVEGTTDIEEPPAPERINCVPKSDGQTIFVTWAEPNTICSVTSYNVDWTGDILWSEADDDGTDNGTVERYTLLQATPYTSYSICVLGVVGDRDGNETCCEAQTDEAPPSAPQDVSAEASGSRSLAVSWGPPAQLNGVIGSYTVTVGGITPVTVPSDTFSSDVTGLEPCKKYDVTVVANNGGGEGKTSVAVEGTAGVEAPPEPEEIKCAADADNQTVSVNWTKPATACDVATYNVGWTGDILWSDGEDNGSSSTADLSYTLQQATPYTGYRVCVLGVVEGLEGEQDCCVAQTAEALPGPPQSLSVVETKVKEIKVTWHRPEDLNGNLSRYTLSLKEKGSNNILQEHNITSSMDDETLTYWITDLEGNSDYSAEVLAWTGAGPGNYTRAIISTNASLVGPVLGGVAGALLLLVLLVALFVKRDAVAELLVRSNSDASAHSQTPAKEAPIIAAYTPLTVRQQIEALQADDYRNLKAEFSELEKDSYAGSTEVALLPSNCSRNRFCNILPYDDNIVMLKGRHDNYINASYIQDYIGDDLFIATQGPLPATVKHFWELAWEQRVEIIVMLANCQEAGVSKCEQYWPPVKKSMRVSGDIIIVNCYEEHLSSCVVRQLEIRHKQSSRFVKHFHYTDWPDFGVPTECDSLLSFVATVQKSYAAKPPVDGAHIIVHCSAGVGRTGTFIGIWNIWHQDLKMYNKSVDVRRIVLDMRKRRTYMVQSMEQYLKLYECLAEYQESPNRWILREYEEPKQPSYVNIPAKQRPPEDPIYENIGYNDDPIYENTR